MNCIFNVTTRHFTASKADFDTLKSSRLSCPEDHNLRISNAILTIPIFWFEYISSNDNSNSRILMLARMPKLLASMVYIIYQNVFLRIVCN